MYGEMALERGLGSTDLIMLDFGDGTEPVVENEPEPQMAQSQQFITIDFDVIEEPVKSNENSTEPMVSLEPVASQFIMIDFGEGEEIENKKETISQPPQSQQFMTIDFDAIIADNMEQTENAPVQTEEKPQFMEISFDEEPTPVVQREQAPLTPQVEYAYATAKEPPRSKTPANTVLFFASGVEQGLLIYNQSPDGVEAKLTGYLPEGKYYASGMEPIKFDPSKHSEEFDIIRTPDGPYIQQVIMVDEKTLMKIALQGIYPKSPADERKRHYFVVDIHDTERDVRKELIKATYEEDNLHPVAGAIFDTIREVGKTDEGKRVIGDIITSSISKSQK